MLPQPRLHALAQVVALHARRQALGSTYAATFNRFIGGLPAYRAGGVDPSDVEAFAGLFLYAGLEATGLLPVAELIAEERDSLEFRSRSLYRQAEAIALAMDRAWYDADRRDGIFRRTVEAARAVDRLDGLAATLQILDREQSQGAVIRTEIAMAEMLRAIAQHTDAGSRQAAEAINRQLAMAIRFLTDEQTLQMFRARSIWDLIARVVGDGQQPLPGASEVERAKAGAALISWMAGPVNIILEQNGQLMAVLNNDATPFRLASRWAIGSGNRSVGGFA